MSTGMHVRRGWSGDPFAPACGCQVLACGFVEPRNECDQHGLMSGKTIRGMHLASECPAEVRSTVTLWCDYCGDALPSVESRADAPTTPDLQRLGFAADKIVCPECVARVRSTDTTNETKETK